MEEVSKKRISEIDESLFSQVVDSRWKYIADVIQDYEDDAKKHWNIFNEKWG